MSYTVEASGDSCYPGTSVLINKLNLRSQADLDEAEVLTVMVKSAELEAAPPDGPLDFTFYKSLHHALFSQLYDWAGTLRKINISKKGTSFCPVTELESCCTAFFERLQGSHELDGLQRGDFIAELADYYASLNMLHPFREGNGRTQRLFFTFLIRRNGYDIDFSACDTDELMMATIYAAQGVLDPLREFFERTITGPA